MAVTSTNPTDVLAEKIRREWVPFLRNELQFADYATAGTLEQHGSSKSLRWLVLQKFTLDATTALTEATTTQNEITTISVTTVSTAVAQNGAWCKISSLADLASSPETRAQYEEGFAEHGARTIDTLIRNVADDTTTFLVSGQVASGTGTLATTNTATAQDIAVLSGIFHINDARSLPQLGSEAEYVVIVHGEVEQDLVTDVTTVRLSWAEINKNVPGMDGQLKIVRGSPGSVYGTMVKRSNNITTAVLTNTVTAYKNIALSKDAVGRVPWNGMDANIVIKISGSQDTSNPLNTFGTMGWTAYTGQALLESTRAIVYYSAK